ncbi:MAG: hypothetical protein U5K00_10325 [Melioribacteraceae bacterium]|nr:hypothetical protein [Melioribacteraceae bacterium]
MSAAHQDCLGFVGTLPAAVGAAGSHAQLLQRIHAAPGVLADFMVGDGIADAYEHGTTILRIRTIVNNYPVNFSWQLLTRH